MRYVIVYERNIRVEVWDVNIRVRKKKWFGIKYLDSFEYFVEKCLELLWFVLMFL